MKKILMKIYCFLVRKMKEILQECLCEDSIKSFLFQLPVVLFLLAVLIFYHYKTIQ